MQGLSFGTFSLRDQRNENDVTLYFFNKVLSKMENNLLFQITLISRKLRIGY